MKLEIEIDKCTFKQLKKVADDLGLSVEQLAKDVLK